MIDRAYLERLARELTDEGKLVEAGWVGLRLAAIPEDAPKVQLQEMRKAFFAGAQHLFSSILSILDQGEEPTADDLRRMDLINAELGQFVEELQREIGSKGVG